MCYDLLRFSPTFRDLSAENSAVRSFPCVPCVPRELPTPRAAGCPPKPQNGARRVAGEPPSLSIRRRGSPHPEPPKRGRRKKPSAKTSKQQSNPFYGGPLWHPGFLGGRVWWWWWQSVAVAVAVGSGLACLAGCGCDTGGCVVTTLVLWRGIHPDSSPPWVNAWACWGLPWVAVGCPGCPIPVCPGWGPGPCWIHPGLCRSASGAFATSCHCLSSCSLPWSDSGLCWGASWPGPSAFCWSLGMPWRGCLVMMVHCVGAGNCWAALCWGSCGWLVLVGALCWKFLTGIDGAFIVLELLGFLPRGWYCWIFWILPCAGD